MDVLTDGGIKNDRHHMLQRIYDTLNSALSQEIPAVVAKGAKPKAVGREVLEKGGKPKDKK